MPFVNTFETVTAGNSATTTIQFMLPVGSNAANGLISYELVDANGTVYSSGLGTGYTVATVANAVMVSANLVVAVPSNIPVNVTGTAYQVRVSLNVPGQAITQLFAQLPVLPNTYVTQGSSDVVEMKGNTCQVELVLPHNYNTVTANLYYLNEQINPAPPTVTGPNSTSDGYLWTINLDTSTQLTPASLIPYNFIWTYSDTGGPTSSETSSIYIVTPSIMQAMKDLMAKINKARSSLGDKPTFSVTDALTYLRRGMDAFNGYGIPTIFTMTNATGPVRNYWINMSEIEALRSQYMAESEAAFDFQGQAISLSIDRTQYYEALASAIENQIQEPMRTLKQNLGKRGALAGDGNVDPTQLRQGAIGTIGISLSPVSNLRPFNANYWLGGLRNIF